MESSSDCEPGPAPPAPTRTPRRGLKRQSSAEYVFSHGEESSAEEHHETIPDEEIEELEESEISKTPRKRKKLPDIPIDTFSPIHFKNDSTNGYMPYVPGRWTPQVTYRLPNDIILDTIRNSGSEGLGRIELGQTIGYDATLKTGGRRVSNHISSCQTEHSDYIGQYQKMNGKSRTIRFFWKQNEKPERFEKLLHEFLDHSGVPCPFKIGEVIKFAPEKKLNTLRISDVTLKRLNRLLEMANNQRVLVTIHRIMKAIGEAEQAEGYKFQIDKKSVMKCLFALKSKGLIQVWETTVRPENVDHQITIVAHRTIERVDDAQVRNAISELLDTYHKEGRVFPHGQLKVSKKRLEEKPGHEEVTEFDGKMEDIDEDLAKNRTIKDRYHFFRLQTVRNSWSKKNSFNPAAEEEEAIDDSQNFEGLDEMLDEEEDPTQAMLDLFAKNPTVPTPIKRSNQYYFGRDSLGYQQKAIRLSIIHEMAFHFVHGHEDTKDASIFKIFPPTQTFESWPVETEDTVRVFFDEDSPYRYMPSQPEYEGVGRGWFMVQDFLAALPLSVFVLANYVPKTVDHATLMSFLQDPLRRHLPIGYLPVEIRHVLMKEKKIHKQLQHSFYILGAMGLVGLGPNPSVKRFPTAASDMFFIAKSAQIYDTSTSAKGYACVNPPLEEGAYVKYEYGFDTKTEVILYWHHLRAIVQSTPLSYRMDDIGEQKYAQRHKQFSIGVFDKRLVEQPQEPNIEKLYPNVQHDGVAGFDSALFIHLKRHWELTTIPHSVVSWFVNRFRNLSDKMKAMIESRVNSVQKDWNNFVRLSLADIDFMKSSNANSLKLDCPQKKVRKMASKSRGQNGEDLENGEKSNPKRPKKRKLDSVDLVSSSARVSVRCRFTPKERDQLIMIRAVGFFLNPVYRFWLDPTVLRDLMHEFVPESRNKTVQSLMACGVRELVRPHRLAYLQRVVRNLSTFPEMRRLRTELLTSEASAPTKTEFFKDAFRTAMRLLFVDNDRIPPTSISDANFRQFLTTGNVSVTKEITVSNSVPHRSQKPNNIMHIQHCVTSNVLISVLLHSKNGEFAEKVLDQIPPAVLQSVLQSLRTDGLVSRSRAMEAISDLGNKNHATLSYYFRHFFSHRFHADLVEGSGRLIEEIEDPNTADTVELLGDGPEVVVAAASSFCNGKSAAKNELEMRVDDDILNVFINQTDSESSIKKIRYLESADLHFEKIRVILDRNSAFEPEHCPKIGQVLEIMDHSREDKEAQIFDEWIMTINYGVAQRREMRAVMHVIKNSKAAGLTLMDVSAKVKIPLARIKIILEELNKGRQVLICGVDDHRYVHIAYEKCWTVMINGRRWCPRPWISPEGAISLPVVRWIAESVLLLIVGKLGIQLKDVIITYEFAVQPIAIREIISLLEQLECIEIIEKSFKNPKMTSPFAPPTSEQTITYINPTIDAVEKFSKIFHKIELLPTILAKSY